LRVYIQRIIFILSSYLFGDRRYGTLCRLNGQLGSTMFSVAMALGYAWHHNLTPIFDKYKE